MNSLKVKLLDQLMSHLTDSQGRDLKELLDQSKMPMEGSPLEEAMDGPKEALLKGDKPKGISIEKVEVLGKPKDPTQGQFDEKADQAIQDATSAGEEEMSDDELEELLSQYLKKG
jgi:hypothetical protein